MGHTLIGAARSSGRPAAGAGARKKSGPIRSEGPASGLNERIPAGRRTNQRSRHIFGPVKAAPAAQTEANTDMRTAN